MPFFEDLDETGIVEHHASQVQSLQDEQASDIVSIYKEVRLELIDRLQHLRDDTFTAQHLRGVLAQVEAALKSISGSLLNKMSAGAEEISTMSLKNLMTEIQKFSHHFRGAIQPINLDVVKIALDSRNFLVNQYQASIDAYSSELRKTITHGLTKAAIEEQFYPSVVRDIGSFFQDEEYKAHRIVRTELHNIYGQSKLKGLKEAKKDAIPNLKKSLYHPMDSRTGKDSIELARQNPIVPIDEPFVQEYKASKNSKTITYRFMAPPNRPNDRAILIPYSEDWDKE